jgi:hypothetical protein
MFLTNFGRVGKSFIKSITGVQENYSIIDYIELTDISICERCPFFEKTSPEQSKYCQDYCDKAKIKKAKTTYYNEANRYRIPIRERLSKSQILLYHFLDVDSNGVVKNISTKEIAEILDCDVKTVKNNNERFVELNYILFSQSSNDEFTILLRDYKNYHLTAKEGGSGYITMSKDLFKNLLEIDNVNSLRLELRELIEFDNKNINPENNTQGEYTYREIKRFLPEYLRYKGAIDKIIENGSNSFIMQKNQEGIIFELKYEYKSEKLKQDILDECDIALDDYFNKFNFTEKNLTDIFQMSLQYGVENIKDSLEIIYNGYILKEKRINNLGGLIRKTTIHKKVS